MCRYWYFIKADSVEQLESAAIFNVKVGESKRAQAAHAAICAQALTSDSIYYCIKSDESLIFTMNLQIQNPNRPVFELKVEQLKSLLAQNSPVETAAYAANVENLCNRIRTNTEYMRRQIRGCENLKSLQIFNTK